MILAALALLGASPVQAPLPVANVHKIYCYVAKEKMNYQGTGWFIQDGIMATAMHVVNEGVCRDETTGQPIHYYATDRKHDFALVAGSTGESIVKYSCKKPEVGKLYHSYGYSSKYRGGDFWNPLPLKFDISATKTRNVLIPGLYNLYPMRQYTGAILNGMSGGPVAGDDGVAIALNNAGDDETTYLFDLADTALCTGKWD